ncbi:MAG TPA: AraC family transcriptional regulator [Draconibacterium sp.]|nr:AraC family transcriptional regulator [Draconibacterium sp.]
MKSGGENIPVYSLHNFSSVERASQQFQVEVFDANRHFAVKYPHRHDFFEVLFLQKGTGSHIIDGNKYNIEPPCIFFMSPGQAHKIELSHDIEGFIYIFTSEFYLLNQRNPNRLIEFPFFFTIRQNNPPLLLKNKNDNQFLESLFIKGIEEVRKGKDTSIHILRAVLDLILTTCAALYPYDENQWKGKGHLVVKKFFQLLEEHFHENLSVAEYANFMALTPSHLTQTVTRLTGKTSSQIIKSKQIIEIKRLLVHTSLGVSEIAAKMNFPDQSYFAKFFKREVGMSPMQYRSQSI